mmetsp:Transcript_6082/g.9470  ORF Transcript_6082/g.9470 Transcript_6082/m.9470 type:complete len:202 (+) Transcript_6082:1997-2602(+)
MKLLIVFEKQQSVPTEQRVVVILNKSMVPILLSKTQLRRSIVTPEMLRVIFLKKPKLVLSKRLPNLKKPSLDCAIKPSMWVNFLKTYNFWHDLMIPWKNFPRSLMMYSTTLMVIYMVHLLVNNKISMKLMPLWVILQMLFHQMNVSRQHKMYLIVCKMIMQRLLLLPKHWLKIMTSMLQKIQMPNENCLKLVKHLKNSHHN